MDPSSELSSLKDNVSGELFDLSVPTLNNEFGYEHITYSIKYGIFYPIKKYRQEMKAILDSGLDDDKNPKRRMRSLFLLYCENFRPTKDLFPYFCCFLNGGGSNPDWAFGQYINQDLIITVAGGNIITLFGQLLMNMIDQFILCINNIAGDPFPFEEWDIGKKDYIPANFNRSAFKWRNYLFETKFSDWTETDHNIFKLGFSRLSPTNQLLLSQLENDGDYSKENLWVMISKYFITYQHRDQASAYDITRFIGESKASDFDFKLSPNIHPEIRKNGDYFDYLNPDNPINDTLYYLNDESQKRVKTPPSAGFLLIRAKSLIYCARSPKARKYTNSDLKKYQNTCARELGSWVYSLFPQTMQKEYLEKVTPDSDCYKFLKNLLDKKEIISSATRNNIDEILKFFLAGAYLPMNRRGDLYAILPPQENSTEALISYLNNTSYNLNKYIELWLRRKLVYQAGFKLDRGIPDFSYDEICNLFLNLNTLLYEGSNIIPKICSDILITFLNDPRYYTERVLESLIKTVSNYKKKSCFMTTSEIVLVPSNREFSPALKIMKKIFESIQINDDVKDHRSARDRGGILSGLPDGVRVTINAIKTPFRTPDTSLEELEELMIQQQFSRAPPNVEYVPLAREEHTEGPEEIGRGLIKPIKKTRKKKNKVNKKIKNLKSKKYKSYKH